MVLDQTVQQLHQKIVNGKKSKKGWEFFQNIAMEAIGYAHLTKNRKLHLRYLVQAANATLANENWHSQRYLLKPIVEAVDSFGRHQNNTEWRYLGSIHRRVQRLFEIIEVYDETICDEYGEIINRNVYLGPKDSPAKIVDLSLWRIYKHDG